MSPEGVWITPCSVEVTGSCVWAWTSGLIHCLLLLLGEWEPVTDGAAGHDGSFGWTGRARALVSLLAT